MKFKINFRNGVIKLLAEYKDIVKEEVKEGIGWRRKIEKNMLSDNDFQTLLKHICSQLLVQGRGAKGVETQIDSIEERIGQWSIKNIKKNLGNMGMSDRKMRKLKEILRYLSNNSVNEWIIGLHKGISNIPHIGLKSDDDFLKNHGFYEHVPIDRHTQRFLFRTGILHWYLKRNNKEILILFQGTYNQKYELFQKTLVEFVKEFCGDIYVSLQNAKLPLAENPGILDILIWRHCGEDEFLGCKNICGSKPKCDKCVLKEACLWYLLRV